MATDYWYKQAAKSPLFPDMLWSRPENKLHAGKLLIIGGNLHGFSAPAQAFAEAQKAGVGVARVILPSAIQKTVGKFMPEADFAPSTPSGSFAQQALSIWLQNAAWADGVLIAGDIGRNSETAITLEKFLSKHKGPVTITKDALDCCLATPKLVLAREDTIIACTIAGLQKLATNANFPQAFTFGMDLLRIVENLHVFTLTHKAHIITRHHDIALVAVNGQVSTTTVPPAETWRVQAAAHAAVWQLQHPTEPFKALTTSIVEY